MPGRAFDPGCVKTFGSILISRGKILALFAGGSDDALVEGAIAVRARCFPESLKIGSVKINPVRVIDVFVTTDLAELGFSGVEPEVTGRPSYHPRFCLKLYILRLSQPGSSRAVGFEREAGRNVEVIG